MRGIVAGPADAVARPEHHGLGPVDLDCAAARAHLARPPGHRPAVRALQHDDAARAVEFAHQALLALPDAEALVGPVEGHDVARRIVGRLHLLGGGEAEGYQPLAPQCRAVDRAVSGQALTNVAVDGLPQRVARRHQPGVLPLLW